jgi:hypothetical protein
MQAGDEQQQQHDDPSSSIHHYARQIIIIITTAHISPVLSLFHKLIDQLVCKLELFNFNHAITSFFRPSRQTAAITHCCLLLRYAAAVAVHCISDSQKEENDLFAAAAVEHRLDLDDVDL